MNKIIFTLFVIITLITNNTRAASQDNNSAPSTSPTEFDTGILAKCVKSNGETYTLENVNNPVFNGKVYNAKILHQTPPNKQILNTNNIIEWTVDGCKNSGDELDAFASRDASPQEFGEGPIRIANLNLIRDIKLKKKAHYFLFIYITAPNGSPSKYFHVDTKSYAVIGLDSSGKMDDNNLRDVSGLRIISGPFNMNYILQNIQDVSDGGMIRIDTNALKAQFEGIQQLGYLYTENINNAKNWLSGLKNIGRYEDLNNQAQAITTFLNSITLGSVGIDKENFQYIDRMNSDFYMKINKLNLIKANILSIFNQMNTIAKSMPGTEPPSLAEMFKDPKKYTLVWRLISDALDRDQNAIDIFYALDDWTTQSQAFTDRINQLKGVQNNFLPKVHTQINTLIQKIDAIKDERTNFEKALKNSISVGKGDVNNVVHTAYDTLKQDITNLNKMNSDIQTLINSGKTIKDDQLQASLATEVARLGQVIPEIKSLLDYGTHQLPQAMSAAYEPAQNKANQLVNETITEVNTLIPQIEATLKPIIEKLKANQDASQIYGAAKDQITATLNTLIGDKTKLDQMAPSVTDRQLKNIITTTQSTIETEKSRVAQVEQLVANNAINDHLAKAEAIKASFNSATGEFRKAYNQYVAAKRTGAPSATPVMQEYTKIYNLMQEVVPLLKADLETMSPADKRKLAITAYVGPKIVGTSLAFIVQTAATQLMTLGIQVTPPQ